MTQQTELSRIMSYLGSRKTEKKKQASRANLAKANAARAAKKTVPADSSTGKASS